MSAPQRRMRRDKTITRNYDLKRVLARRVNARGAASGAEVFLLRPGGALLGVRTRLFRPEGAHPCALVSEGGVD